MTEFSTASLDFGRVPHPNLGPKCMRRAGHCADSSPVRLARGLSFPTGSMGCVARNDPRLPALINTRRQRLECSSVSSGPLDSLGKAAGWGGVGVWGGGIQEGENLCASGELMAMSKTQGRRASCVPAERETRPGEHRELGKAEATCSHACGCALPL